MISHGVEISIAGGGADEQDGPYVHAVVLVYMLKENKFREHFKDNW